MTKTAYAPTALALLFGLGVALTGAAGGAPVAGGGVGPQEEGVMDSPEAGGWEICDRNEDGFIDSQEAYVCGEARFDEMAAGEEVVGQEQFLGGAGEVADAEGMFEAMDADASGDISRDEFLTYREEGFAAATEGSEGRMTVEDYEMFERGEM